MNNKTSKRPADFNLFITADVVQGALESIHNFLADIPTTEPELTNWHASINGLAWAGRKAAREINTFLLEASDRHRFPYMYQMIECEGADGVRETPGVYLVKAG